MVLVRRLESLERYGPGPSLEEMECKSARALVEKMTSLLELMGSSLQNLDTCDPALVALASSNVCLQAAPVVDVGGQKPSGPTPGEAKLPLTG